MRKAISIALVAAAAAAAILFSAPAAQAQVRVEGQFRLPHGDIAFGVGDPYYDVGYGAPAYPIGSYVPYGYRVVEDPRFGWGFYSPVFACRAHHVHHRHWIPARRYATRWVVIERPYFGGRYYRRGYDRYRRYDGRRYDRRRYDGAYSRDPYYDREYRGDHSYDDPYDRPYR